MPIHEVALLILLPDRIKILKSWFLWREESRGTQRKNPLNKDENQHKLEPGPQRWETSALVTEPSLLPDEVMSYHVKLWCFKG